MQSQTKEGVEPHLHREVKPLLITVFTTIFLLIAKPAFAASLLYDSFDKPTIDTNKWTVVDTENKLSITPYGELGLGRKATPVYGDPSIYSQQTFERVPGRTIMSVIRSSLGFSDAGPVIHFSPTNSPTTPKTVGYGTVIDGIGTNHNYFQAVVPGATFSYTWRVPFRAYDIDYLTATILRSEGSYHLASGGTSGTFPTATLFWVNNTGSEDNLYAGVNNRSSRAQISSVRVTDLPGQFASENGLATAVDTFTRADSTNLGETEKGGGDWDEKIGDIEIVDGKFQRIGTTQARAIFDSGTSDGIFEMTFTAPAAPYAAPMIYFRYQDESNWWRVLCNNSTWVLQKRVAGVETVVTQGGWNCSPNTTHRMVVRAHGSSIVVWDNDKNVMWTDGGILDSSLLDATGVGVGFQVVDPGNPIPAPTIDEIKVWPRTVTLPAGKEMFPTVPSSGDTTLISDSFTDADGARLNAHTPEINIPGGSWTEHVGIWTVNDNKVSPTSAPEYATIEAGQIDMSISADFDLGAGPDLGSGDWFNSLIGRWINNQNYMNARFLWQNNSPEIEFWDHVDGSIANFCAVSLIGDVTQNTTYNMRMVIVGKKVGIYLDGKLVLECFTSNLTGTRAGIGLGLETNTYDNFVVKTAAHDTAPPPEVTDLAVDSTPTSSSPSFSWTPVIDDAIGTSFYRVYRSTTSGVLGTQINADDETTTSTHTDDSLVFNGTYYYTARAVDAHDNENDMSDNSQVAVAYTGGISPPSTATPSPTPTPSSKSTPSPAKPPACKATTPSSTPWLYGASAKSSNSILLQFSEASDPVSEYVVEYGTEAGNYRFAAANIGGKGTTGYLVGSLSPNTTYYLRVRAGNGCATGEWSNEISAKTYSGLSATGSFDTEIIESEVRPREQIEEKETQKSEEERTESEKTTTEAGQVLGVNVKIKVVDENKKPVGGAKVTLYSTPRETTTNKDGIALFEGVEPGEHRAVIAYKDQSGEQKINVPDNGEVGEIDFTIQITPTNPFSNSWVMVVIGALALGFVVLLILLFRRRRNS